MKQVACECGVTLKFASLPEHEDQWEAFLAVWTHFHRGHEPTSIGDARDIRDRTIRRRREKEKR